MRRDSQSAREVCHEASHQTSDARMNTNTLSTLAALGLRVSCPAPKQQGAKGPCVAQKGMTSTHVGLAQASMDASQFVCRDMHRAQSRASGSLGR